MIYRPALVSMLPLLGNHLSLASCPLQCRPRSHHRHLPPYSSQAKVQSCKPWLPSLSDHRLPFRAPSRHWRRHPNARLRPPSRVVFAAVAVPRYPGSRQLLPRGCLHILLILSRLLYFICPISFFSSYSLKILLKGQTAFQRKGSSQLFCSTVCLTGYLPVTKNRNCFQCNRCDSHRFPSLCCLSGSSFKILITSVFSRRDISQPRDMITIPIGNNSYTHFCGQFCLSIFRHKTKQPGSASKLPEKPVERKPEKPAERPVDSQVCTVCKIVNRVRDLTRQDAA